MGVRFGLLWNPGGARNGALIYEFVALVMAQFLRRDLVSQNKQRHVETVDGKKLDLDLTYLTETIICMGLPATGFERNYRR